MGPAAVSVAPVVVVEVAATADNGSTIEYLASTNRMRTRIVHASSVYRHIRVRNAKGQSKTWHAGDNKRPSLATLETRSKHVEERLARPDHISRMVEHTSPVVGHASTTANNAATIVDHGSQTTIRCH